MHEKRRPKPTCAATLINVFPLRRKLVWEPHATPNRARHHGQQNKQ